MKKLRQNINAKCLALLVMTLTSLISIVMFSGAGILQSFGAYSAAKLSDSRLLDNLTDFEKERLQDIELLFGDRQLDFRMEYAKEKNGEPLCNTVVLVTDPFGNVLLNNYEAEIIPSTVQKWTLAYTTYRAVEPSFVFCEGHDNPPVTMPFIDIVGSHAVDMSFREWLFDIKNINTGGLSEDEVVALYFDDYYDEYASSYSGEELYTIPDSYCNITLGIAQDTAAPFSKTHLAISAFENKWLILAAAIICGIVSLALDVPLIFAAGWRPGSDRPVGSVIERIPLGIFLLLSGAILWLLIYIMGLISQRSGNSAFSLILFGLIVYAQMLVAVGSVYSLIARFKCKGWTKNTVIYKLYVLFGWIGRNLSDLGTVLLCIGGWLLVNIVLLAFTLDRLGLGLMLMGIFNLIAAAVIAAVAAQWQRLRRSAAIISEGDTSHRIDTGRMFRYLRDHGEVINRMGEGVATAVDEQMKSERMKTDLITNVSHDLKTPLTSIISYVDLLKGQHIENETALGYIETLDRQAIRLSRLVEDLVEASKATSGSITAHIISINAGELLEQAVSEYEMRLEQSGITPVLTLHDEHLTTLADGRLLWRVFDNLMSNVCKYGLSGTRLYIDARRDGGRVLFTFRNISASRLNVPAEDLMERFVRGDSSRTTSGSGLGLTIARSLVELQDGLFSLEIDGDMFKAHVSLPAGSDAAVPQGDM